MKGIANVCITFGNETASTVDTRWVELHELQVLQGQTSTNNHRIPISGTGVSTRAAEIGTSISASSQNSLVRPKSMQCAVFHIEGDYTDTFPILHNQVKSKELNEEVGVVAERLAIKSMEERMPCTVSGSGATIRLSALSIFERLATKCALVDFTLLCS
jgi:hypothetical protein